MATTDPARRQDLKVYVNAAAKETTYGAANTPDTTVQLLMGAGFVPPVEMPTKVKNPGMTTGTEGANAQLLSNLYYVGTLQWDWVYPNDVAFAFGYGLGTVTSTQNAATGQYEHDITDVTTTRTLPSFTMVVHFTADLYKQYLGCVINRVTFGAGVQSATMSAEVWANGVANVDASDALLTDEPCIIYTSAPATAQEMNLFIGTAAEGSFDAAIDTADVSSPIAGTQARARTFEVTVDNGLTVENMLTFESVSKLARAERNIRAVSGRFSIEEDGQYTLQGYVASATTYALEYGWDSKSVAGTAGDNYAVQFVIPDASLESYSTTYSESGRQVNTYEWIALDADTTLHRIIATVWNEVAAYAA